MCTVNANVVRGRSYEKFYTKVYHMKISLHENFKIYGILLIAGIHKKVSTHIYTYTTDITHFLATNYSAKTTCQHVKL